MPAVLGLRTRDALLPTSLFLPSEFTSDEAVCGRPIARSLRNKHVVVACSSLRIPPQNTRLELASATPHFCFTSALPSPVCAGLFGHLDAYPRPVDSLDIAATPRRQGPRVGRLAGRRERIFLLRLLVSNRACVQAFLRLTASWSECVL
eukprot:1426393-Pleurochrysis_carterae.AAC.1